MKIHVEDPTKDCFVLFGVSGWHSSVYYISDKNFNIDNLYEFCNRRIPHDVRNSHPDNAKIKYIKIYRLETKYKFTDSSTPVEIWESLVVGSGMDLHKESLDHSP